VQTKHGNVNTDHILFICSGAFHSAKPSDMLAELQVSVDDASHSSTVMCVGLALVLTCLPHSYPQPDRSDDEHASYPQRPTACGSACGSARSCVQ
jgi:hypothetical protein